jgi:tetratricopeptide (TPR) repeat protein
MQLTLEEITVYPLPGLSANSVWGCLVHTTEPVNTHHLGKNECCQMVHPNLLIPEKAMLHPAITSEEAGKLFPKNIHAFHPEFGLAELEEAVEWTSLLKNITIQSCAITAPRPSIFIPKQVKSFRVQPVSPEEILRNMEENVFPKKEKLKDKPLNILEKVKHTFYKLLFKKTKPASNEEAPVTEKKRWWATLSRAFKPRSEKPNNWINKMEQDFDNLEKRNQKQLDKLLELLRKNPAEALKYAIPLDGEGTSRGQTGRGYFNLDKRWFDFSLFGNMGGGGGGGGSIDIGDKYYILQTQYQNTARALMEQKEYQKAAFVYMKLLKDYPQAAQCLETGNHYAEAATIYLKHVQDKQKAAACYEKGNMVNDAIALYKELNENEKVGDLYLGMHKRKEANEYFQKVVDDYAARHQFVKASIVCKQKINDDATAQGLLMEGWRKNRDASNCLNMYFSNIDDLKERKTAIDNVYNNDLTGINRETFLHVIRNEFAKNNELSEDIKEMAYQVIAAEIQTNSGIVSHLKEFNIDDQELVKDTMRFRLGKRKG